MTPTFSIIVATSGRTTLTRTLASLAQQLEHGDELLVIRNNQAPWGHATRDEAMKRANGSHLWFMDDDDISTPDALSEIRAAVSLRPDAVHIFRMQQDRLVLWQQPIARVGNVGTPMMVIPNQPGKVGGWGTRYEADGDFLMETLALRGDQPVFHEHVVALIRP